MGEERKKVRQQLSLPVTTTCSDNCRKSKILPVRRNHSTLCSIEEKQGHAHTDGLRENGMTHQSTCDHVAFFRERLRVLFCFFQDVLQDNAEHPVYGRQNIAMLRARRGERRRRYSSPLVCDRGQFQKETGASLAGKKKLNRVCARGRIQARPRTGVGRREDTAVAHL